MTDVSVKRVQKDKLQNAIDDNISMGFTLKSQSDNVALLEKPGNWGTIGWHIVILHLRLDRHLLSRTET